MHVATPAQPHAVPALIIGGNHGIDLGIDINADLFVAIKKASIFDAEPTDQRHLGAILGRRHILRRLHTKSPVAFAVGPPFEGAGYHATRVRHTFDQEQGFRTHFEAERPTIEEGA